MESKWEERIAALLRKAESTRSDSEREACLEKAEELMIKWGIDRAVVEARNIAEGRVETNITKRAMTFDGMYGQTRNDHISIAHQLFMALGNLKTVKIPRWDMKKNKYIYDLFVVGFESDLDAAMMLYSSVSIQIIHGQVEFWKKEVMKDQGCRGFPAHVRTKMKSDYAQGFIYRVSERLRAIRFREEDDAKGTGTDLVLVNRANLVEKMFSEMYPNTTKSGARSKSRSRYAFESGQRDGSNADLGQKRFSRGRTAIDG